MNASLVAPSISPPLFVLASKAGTIKFTTPKISFSVVVMDFFAWLSFSLAQEKVANPRRENDEQETPCCHFSPNDVSKPIKLGSISCGSRKCGN